MKDLLELLGRMQGALGAVGFLVAVVFGSLYGKNKATIDSYKVSNQAYKDELTARDIQHKANADKIQLLEQKSEVLESIVTQAPSIVKLAGQMAKQHKMTMQQLGAVVNKLGNIADVLTRDKEL